VIRGWNQDIPTIGLQVDSGQSVVPTGQSILVLKQDMPPAAPGGLLDGIGQRTVFGHQFGQALFTTMTRVNIERIKSRYRSGRYGYVRLWPLGPPLPYLV
jgi:hypothetical protein